MRELMVPVFHNGERIYQSPSVKEIAAYCTQEKATLWDETKRLFYEPRYLEMCKKYMSRISNWGAENNKLEVNFENIRKNGIRAFDEKEVFRLCSKTIREEDYDEEDLNVTKREEFDKTQEYEVGKKQYDRQNKAPYMAPGIGIDLDDLNRELSQEIKKIYKDDGQ